MTELLLKNCPLCGSKDVSFSHDGIEHYVQCDNCALTGAYGSDRDQCLEYWNDRPSPWIGTDKKLPPYGEPVLIVGNGAPQHVTYIRDGGDDCDDWFEPYHFEHDDNCKIPASDITHWQPIAGLEESV